MSAGTAARARDLLYTLTVCFVSEAVLHFVATNGRRNLAEQLKASCQANADESLRIAAEWFPIEEEASQPRRDGHRSKTSK